jgi:hypothetical protein
VVKTQMATTTGKLGEVRVDQSPVNPSKGATTPHTHSCRAGIVPEHFVTALYSVYSVFLRSIV